ncbi:MAG: V-type ATP synthase subunit I [Bacteroidetes bacterium ADurb.BinA395]|mgnify:FL=1|jgi:V/A-type H+-transporting ATPase subunit I|nr:MAG: V-type ATP synthase subunit I [Bacteroidetes bacterium ADurb.BinA395]
MILQMTRYTFLVYHKQYHDFLEKMREVGVVHVIEKVEGIAENDELREKMLLSSRMKIALKQMEKLIPQDASPLPADLSVDGMELLKKIENKFAEKELLIQKLQLAEKERDRMEMWGIFDYQLIENLQKAGYEINFFSCNVRKFDQEWEIRYNAFEIDNIGSTRYFVTITHTGEIIEIDADPVKIGTKNVLQIDEDIQQIHQEIDNINRQLITLSVENYNSLKAAQVKVIENMDFARVLLNTEPTVENKVMLLEGWCPEDAEEKLKEFLNETDIYYETSKPEEDEKVPVKLKNNRFSRLFEFIGNLYDLPNYHELDLTPFFAPFYMLFFGICFGDAAYGLLLLIASLYFRKKADAALKPILSLAALLGISTVIMGFVSGTFFGFNLLEMDVPWLASFKAFMLDSNQLFYTSLLLGVVQILFGMVIKAIGKVKRYGWPASFSTWGWLILLIGCGGTFVLSSFAGLSPQTAKWLYIIFGSAGGALVFLLNNIKRNPLINIGSGLWDTYNTATGLLGDVLSYIRLFALGISGAVMGFVFNDLAINLSGNIPIVSTLIMLVIMIFGHGINIFMCGLGAFVHPMRLTFVEFYKNAGFEGGGKKYKPFSHFKEEKSII